MTIDTSEIGIVAAKVMDDIEELQKGGDFPDDCRVVAALVTYEIRSATEGTSTVGGRCTADWTVLGLGLLERMRDSMLYPDEE